MALESKLDLSETFSDLPPESFWVPSDDEQDWFNHNAVMQRKTSLKLGFNRNFTHVPSKYVKSSQPSVFGLPNLQISDRNLPEKKRGKLLFRSRSEPGGRPVVHASEPVSPRVSCTGRVRFKTGDAKKTGFSRLLSSFLPTGMGKSRSRKRGNGIAS